MAPSLVTTYTVLLFGTEIATCSFICCYNVYFTRLIIHVAFKGVLLFHCRAAVVDREGCTVSQVWLSPQISASQTDLFVARDPLCIQGGKPEPEPRPSRSPSHCVYLL